MTKVCKKCGAAKALTDFNLHSNTRDKKRPDCSACHARYHRQKRLENDRDFYREAELKKKYGLSVSDYNAMFAEQDGKCAICDIHISQIDFGKWMTLVVDHDHATGSNRSLLCSKCNIGLGAFNDDASRMESAAKYLRLHAGRRK